MAYRILGEDVRRLSADPAARTGITLGGDSIRPDALWQGKWIPLSAPQSGRYQVDLPAPCAVVVRLSVP